MNLSAWFWPKRADSVEEFMRLAKDSNNLRISAACTINVEGGMRLHSVGLTGTFFYILVLIASGGTGRRITTSVSVATRIGSEYGLSDARERNAANNQAYLQMDEIIRQIETQVPKVQFTIITPNRQAASRESWDDMISGLRK